MRAALKTRTVRQLLFVRAIIIDEYCSRNSIPDSFLTKYVQFTKHDFLYTNYYFVRLFLKKKIYIYRFDILRSSLLNKIDVIKQNFVTDRASKLIVATGDLG